jgi:hypothetical protein
MNSANASPKETLRAFGRKEVTMEQVVRALISYDGWLVPASFAVDATGLTKFAQGYVFGDCTSGCDVPANELWIYTDSDAADYAVAKGGRLGFYSGGLRGTQVFAALPASASALQINPGCKPTETWYFGRDAFSLAALWARAIAIEARLGEPDSPENFAALLAHPGYVFFIHPEQNAIATAPGFDGMKNPALVFTAIDSAQALEREHPHLQRQVVDGRTLFPHLLKQGVDGVVFNILGPGPQVTRDLAFCHALAAAAAT